MDSPRRRALHSGEPPPTSPVRIHNAHHRASNTFKHTSSDLSGDASSSRSTSVSSHRRKANAFRPENPTAVQWGQVTPSNSGRELSLMPAMHHQSPHLNSTLKRKRNISPTNGEKPSHASQSGSPLTPKRRLPSAPSARSPLPLATEELSRTPTVSTPAASGDLPPNVPTGPRVLAPPHPPIEKTPVVPTLSQKPYIFISRSSVPVRGATIPHLERRLKDYDWRDVKADDSGYFIIFEDSKEGEEEMMRCVEECDYKLLFNYIMIMEARPYGNCSFEFPSPESKPRHPYLFISARFNNLDANQSNAKGIAIWLRDYKVSDVEIDEEHGFYVKFPTNEHAEKCYLERNLSRPYIFDSSSWLLDKGMTIKMIPFLKEPETSTPRSEDVRKAVKPISSSEKGANFPISSPGFEEPAIADMTKYTTSSEASGIDVAETRADKLESSTTWAKIPLLEGTSDNSTLPGSSSFTAVQKAFDLGTAVNGENVDGDVQVDKGKKGTMEKSVTMSHGSAIPAGLTQVPRTPLEDDSSSIITPSEHSSTTSRPRELRCHECKGAHVTARNPLVPCNFCPRRFHKSCQRPTPDENQPASSWGCYRCVKNGRVKVNRTLDPTSASEMLALPNAATDGPEDTVEIVVPADFVAMDGTSAPAVHSSLCSEIDSHAQDPNSAPYPNNISDSPTLPDSAGVHPENPAEVVATDGTPAPRDLNPAENADNALKSPTVASSTDASPKDPAGAIATNDATASGRPAGRSRKSVPVLQLDMVPGQCWIVKYRGHSPWPAIICDEEMLTKDLITTRPVSAKPIDGTYREEFQNGGRSTKGRRYPIMFLGTNEFAWTHNTDLQPLNMDDVEKQVEAGPRAGSGKALDLWNAYRVAAKNHDLPWFKKMLADEHEQAMQGYNSAKPRGEVEYTASDEDPLINQHLPRRLWRKTGDLGAIETGEASDADSPGVEAEKLEYIHRSEKGSREISIAKVQKTHEQTSSHPEEELTDGSMILDSPSSVCIGGVIMDSPITSLDAGSPTVQRATEGNIHKPEGNQLKPEKMRKSQPLIKSLESAPRSKSKAVRCTHCKGLIPGAPGSKPICTKCKIAKNAARDVTKSAALEPETVVQQNTVQPTSPPRPTPLLSLNIPTQPPNRSLDDPMDVDQESDPSVSQPKEKPIVESILQRDHTSSLSPLSEVPTEKTGTPLQEPAVLSEAEASEGSEAASQKPSTPMQNFSRSLLLREINGLALLALKEKPTMAEIAEWFCKTLPSHKKANMVRLKKTLGPVLTQHKHFLGSSEGGDRKRWRFSAREIKQMYARDLADCFEAASIPSPNQSPSGSEDESLEIERESDFQLTASSPLASSQGGSHWQQVTRGIYKLSKGPAPNGDLEVYSRARTVHLKDECYSTESEVKYSHPDGKGDGKEAWGKIDRIELLDNGRCQIRTLRYVDKNEASALGCKNLREWPRNVRYMRRRQSVMDEISGDDLRGCLSPRESNSVSPALYLSLEDKCKIRVDYSVVGDNQMRHGVDWVESSSDVEDIGTLPEPSPRNRTSNKSRTLQEQASGGHQEDLASSKDQVAQPVPTDKHPKELSAPLVTQPDEGSMAVQSDPISPNPSVRSSGRGRDTMRTALTSSIATDSTPRSEPLFVPTTKISPKRAIVSKDFNAAFPEYVSWDAEERARKIKEIQQRPSRKATFGKKLAFARTHRSNPHVEIEPPKKLLAKKPRSSSPEVVSDKQPSGELSDSSESQKDEQEDGNGLKKLLGLPPSFIPIVYENQLAFRDGTLVNGRLPRPKAFYKVGRNVAGQLI